MRVDAFIGGSHVSRSPIVNCERTINLLLERTKESARGAKAEYAAYLRPGTQVWVDPQTEEAILAGEHRGRIVAEGRWFVLLGGYLTELDSMGNVTIHGELATDGNPGVFAYNGDGGHELGITSGDHYYAFDLETNTLTEVLTSGATQCDEFDGFILILDAATSTFSITDLYDASVVDPTQFQQRSLAPDRWRALKVSKARRFITFYGEFTSERWYNRGLFPFPFAPTVDALIPYGIAAPFSAEDIDGIGLWMGQTENGHGFVLASPGTEPREIGSPDLHVALDRHDSLTGFRSMAFEFQGHKLYMLCSGDDEECWVYDLGHGFWVEWLTWLQQQGRYVAWRPFYHVFFQGKHYMGDRASPKIFELSFDYVVDPDDQPLRWERVCPLPWADNREIEVTRVELLHEPGLGRPTGQGADPVARLEMSWNGGKTWSAERPRAMGKQGEYDTQTFWTRCGSGTKPVVRIVGSDPAPVRLFGLEVDLQIGTEAER